MAIGYTWNVSTVDTYPTLESNADVVYNVHWRLNAVSDQQDAEGNNYAASVYGTHSVNADDISSFVPFADLTNDTVTGWVTAGMGDDEVQSLKDGLDAQIESQKNPTSVTKTLDS